MDLVDGATGGPELSGDDALEALRAAVRDYLDEHDSPTPDPVNLRSLRDRLRALAAPEGQEPVADASAHPRGTPPSMVDVRHLTAPQRRALLAGHDDETLLRRVRPGTLDALRAHGLIEAVPLGHRAGAPHDYRYRLTDRGTAAAEHVRENPTK